MGFLSPGAEDEGRHPPVADALWWNESWYFDAVSHDGSLGVYWRLGRVPNQDVCLVTACIVGPGRPCVLLVRDVALPGFGDETQLVAVDGLMASFDCVTPLRRFEVSVSGEGSVWDDAAGVLADRAPDRFAVIRLALGWETAGEPYQWRQSTRYEIPCTVSGSVRVGQEVVTFRGLGQRDHSWGVRDWFAIDWMWCALHLDDGTHVHASGVPAVPGRGVGYVQRNGALTEISAVTTSSDVGEDGLIRSARVLVGVRGEEPRDLLSMEIAPLAFGPLLLRADDGRVSEFPRCMCRVQCADGRSGFGWIEWNRVRPTPT